MEFAEKKTREKNHLTYLEESASSAAAYSRGTKDIEANLSAFAKSDGYDRATAEDMLREGTLGLLDSIQAEATDERVLAQWAGVTKATEGANWTAALDALDKEHAGYSVEATVSTFLEALQANDLTSVDVAAGLSMQILNDIDAGGLVSDAQMNRARNRMADGIYDRYRREGKLGELAFWTTVDTFEGIGGERISEYRGRAPRARDQLLLEIKQEFRDQPVEGTPIYDGGRFPDIDTNASAGVALGLVKDAEKLLPEKELARFARGIGQVVDELESAVLTEKEVAEWFRAGTPEERGMVALDWRNPTVQAAGNRYIAEYVTPWFNDPSVPSDDRAGLLLDMLRDWGALPSAATTMVQEAVTMAQDPELVEAIAIARDAVGPTPFLGETYASKDSARAIRARAAGLTRRRLIADAGFSAADSALLDIMLLLPGQGPADKLQTALAVRDMVSNPENLGFEETGKLGVPGLGSDDKSFAELIESENQFLEFLENETGEKLDRVSDSMKAQFRVNFLVRAQELRSGGLNPTAAIQAAKQHAARTVMAANPPVNVGGRWLRRGDLAEFQKSGKAIVPEDHFTNQILRQAQELGVDMPDKLLRKIIPISAGNGAYKLFVDDEENPGFIQFQEGTTSFPLLVDFRYEGSHSAEEAWMAAVHGAWEPLIFPDKGSTPVSFREGKANAIDLWMADGKEFKELVYRTSARGRAAASSASRGGFVSGGVEGGTFEGRPGLPEGLREAGAKLDRLGEGIYMRDPKLRDAYERTYAAELAKRKENLGQGFSENSPADALRTFSGPGALTERERRNAHNAAEEAVRAVLERRFKKKSAYDTWKGAFGLLRNLED